MIVGACHGSICTFELNFSAPTVCCINHSCINHCKTEELPISCVCYPGTIRRTVFFAMEPLFLVLVVVFFRPIFSVSRPSFFSRPPNRNSDAGSPNRLSSPLPSGTPRQRPQQWLVNMVLSTICVGAASALSSMYGQDHVAPVPCHSLHCNPDSNLYHPPIPALATMVGATVILHWSSLKPPLFIVFFPPQAPVISVNRYIYLPGIAQWNCV